MRTWYELGISIDGDTQTIARTDRLEELKEHASNQVGRDKRVDFLFIDRWVWSGSDNDMAEIDESFKVIKYDNIQV